MEKIPVTGTLTTAFPDDKYPVIDPLVGIDGLRNLSSLSEMYNIPLERRRAGMVVGISNVSNNSVAYYKLKPEGGGGSIVWQIGSSSNWDGFFNPASASVPVKYFISNETIEVPNNYLYLVYGDLTIGATGVFNNYGKTVIINGDIVTQSNGVWNNYNTLEYVTLDNRLKYSQTFSCRTNQQITITHSLGVQDITYTVRDGFNYIQTNMELSPSSLSYSVILTCAGTVSDGRIVIMG